MAFIETYLECYDEREREEMSVLERMQASPEWE